MRGVIGRRNSTDQAGRGGRGGRTGRAVPLAPDKAALALARRMALRQIGPLAGAVLLVWLVWRQGISLDLHAIQSGLGDIAPLRWAMALALTGLSFWAVGRYDQVVHRIRGTGLHGPGAMQAGACAIAIAQSVGFGVISGALVRWRMLPDLRLMQALGLSITVAVSFLAGWALVAAAMLLLAPVPVLTGFAPLAWAVLLAAVGLVGISLWRPRGLARLPLPPLSAMAAIVALVVVDCLAAGAALYLLMPADALPGLAAFLTVFVLALGAGLVLGTPGGAGPFEVVLLALLPAAPAEPALAGVLAFRLVYYVLPAVIGAGWAIRGPKAGVTAPQPARILPAPTGRALDRIIARAPSAEAALLRQGDLALLTAAGGQAPVAMVAPLGQTLVQLGRPLSPDLPDTATLPLLTRAARTQFRAPCLYKAPPRLAARARRAGWLVLPIAREAWLDPRAWTTDGRSRRQLRRKLRRAEAAGLRISPATGPLPLARMAEIARAWEAARGGERGFSMGRFNPEALRGARIYLAHCQGDLVGFLTLMSNPHEQVLDLMRHGPDAPDGCMHLALDHALRAARAEGIARVSLAAAPIPAGTAAGPVPGPGPALRQRLDRASGGAGLRQFKQAFAPHWQTLYIAAPDRTALVLAAADIARAITRPGRQSRASCAGPQLDHAAFGFASRTDPWQEAEEFSAPDPRTD